MKALVQEKSGEVKVSHRIIAENTDNKQTSIKDMIARNLSDFQEFGEVEIVETKVQTSGGVQLQNTYWLNEQQATLLMTYLRNSEVVKTFKKNLVKAFFMLKEKLENPNIHELSGRVGGLTKANNELRKELDKLRRKSKRRFENLEDDVHELKKRPILISHKNLDEKLEILFRQSADLLNVQGEFTRCTQIEALQKHLKFYRNYVEILKADGNIPQKWAINQVENEKNKRIELEKELYIMKYRLEKTRNKITDLQNFAQKIVDFDAEIEREMSHLDFR